MAQLSVRVTPRASRDEVSGFTGGVLHVRVTAPPDEGRANAAVCMLVARALGVPKTSVSVARGTTARHKVLAIDGMDEGEVAAILDGRRTPRRQ